MGVISCKAVKTKKDHKCFGCARKFPKGSKLQRITSADGGEIQSNYWCDVCQEYWSEYMESDDCIGFGDLKANDFEKWEEIRMKVENEAPNENR